MYSVPEEFKLNKFKHVEVPAPSKFAQRSGLLQMPSSAFTGDEAATMSQSKIDTLSAGIEVYEQFAAEEAEKVSNSK